TSPATATMTVGTPGTFTVTTTGTPAPTIGESGALPAGVTFKDNGNGTATLAGTPTGTGGSFAVTLTAASSAGSVVQAFTLNVTAAPVFTSAASVTFPTGKAGTFAVTASRSPTPTF